MSTNHVPGETIKRYYRVDRRDIAFLRFIFEAYEGLAIIETLNPELGILVFYIAPGCESDVDMILRDLKGDMMIENCRLHIDYLRFASLRAVGSSSRKP